MNSCSGEYVAHGDEVWFAEAVCALTGTTPERDLVQFPLARDETLRYPFTASGDLVFAYGSVEPAALRLRFRHEG